MVDQMVFLSDDCPRSNQLVLTPGWLLRGPSCSSGFHQQKQTKSFGKTYVHLTGSPQKDVVKTYRTPYWLCSTVLPETAKTTPQKQRHNLLVVPLFSSRTVSCLLFEANH